MPRQHRRVNDDPDVVIFAVGRNAGFDFAAEHRVGRLVARDRRDLGAALHLFRAIVRDADRADFARFLQIDHCLPGFFECWAVVFGRPVNLVEIDDVDFQALQAVFAFLFDGSGGVNFRDGALVVPAHRALGENVRAIAFPFFESASDDFFRMAEAVDRGGVDPVDAEFERAVDCGDGVGFFLCAPGEGPASAADGPGAEADGRDHQIGISKLAGLHSSSRFLFCLFYDESCAVAVSWRVKRGRLKPAPTKAKHCTSSASRFAVLRLASEQRL